MERDGHDHIRPSKIAERRAKQSSQVLGASQLVFVLEGDDGRA
jgi:hypothetical protein